jgi:hypothetical protein
VSAADLAAVAFTVAVVALITLAGWAWDRRTGR